MEDFDYQQRQLEQRRQLANQLRQTEIPQGRMVGRIYVKQPGEAIAAALRQYAGMSELKDIDKSAQDLAQRKQQVQREDMQSFVKALRGTPEQIIQPTTPNDDEGNAMPTSTIPAQPGDPYAAYTALSSSRVPELRQMGMAGLAQLPQREMLQAEKQADREARQQMIQQQIEARKEAAMQAFENQKALRQIASASGGAQPYYQPVQTSQGVMVLNARTGRMEPVQINGQNVVGAQYDPTLQGQLTASKEGAKANVEMGVEKQKNVKKADQMIGQLDQADELLKQKPTASGAGALMDAAGRAVGVSSKGAQTAAQLEALSGWLVANVPRMEGPQSNFDVQNYQTMAGKIGDRTVPVAERQAALKEVRRLQEKYKSLNQDVVAPASTQAAQPAPRAANRIRFDANGNVIQ